MITRFHSSIHHFNTTTISTEVPIFLRGTASARPAELILTEATRHMVTPHVLLNPSFAAGAEAHIIFVLGDPLFEIALQGILTTYIFSMPSIPTVKAYFGSTSWAGQELDIAILSSHMRLAASLSAPSNQRIRVQRLLIPKPLILLE